ncbi:PepSY domain-containing protein, partial [Singulisphaera rosea]
MGEEIVAEAPRTRARRQPLGTQAGLYRVLWRWHFYAGLLVSPVLVVVAVTGGLYVFKGELEGVLYPKLMFATPGA